MRFGRVASRRRRLASWLSVVLVAAATAVITPFPASATTCGCTLTGPYVAPATAPLSSSGAGTFSLQATTADGATTVTVKKLSGETMLSHTFTGSGSYGFGPGARSFAVVAFTGATHNARVWNLTGSSGQLVWNIDGSGTASLAFSPPGQYVLYTGASGSTADFRAVSTSNGVVAHQATFNPAPSVVAGFGPDGEALAYAYGSPVTLKLVNLLTRSTVRTVGVTSAASWKFSPCGDVMGVVQTPTGQVSASLYAVKNGAVLGANTVGSTAAASLDVTSARHRLTVGSSTYDLATNTAAATCLVLSPTAGSTGSSVSVNTAGLAAGEPVKVRFNGTEVATGSAPGGAYAGSFVVPDVALGSYPVTVEGQTSKRLYAATFTVNAIARALAVSLAGTGDGTVTSAPAGIECGTVCSALYPVNTPVELKANPGASSTFTGWSGACTGTGPCTVVMSVSRQVTASFRAIDTAYKKSDGTSFGAWQDQGYTSPCVPAYCTYEFPDINGDNLADWVLTHVDGNRAEVVFRLATGTGFGPRQDAITGFVGYDYRGHRFHFADLNGDAKDDLIITRAENGRAEASFRLSTGTGFGASQMIFQWGGPYDYSNRLYQTPDLNGDGKADLVVTRAENGKAEVVYWLSTGTGIGPQRAAIDWAGYDYSGHRFHFADVNGDAKDDLIITRAENGRAEASFRLSTGTGFGTSQMIADWTSGDQSQRLFHFPDLNGDRRADFVTTLATSTMVLGYKYSTGTGFGAMQVIDWGCCSSYHSHRFHFADVSGDGKQDLILTRAENGRAEASLRLSTGTGFAAAQGIFAWTGADYSDRHFGLADFGGDGRADFVIARRPVDT